jgi:hypothetical protein
MHRDKTRCHEKYDETNAHHPHMHGNHPFFKTLSDYNQNGPDIRAKNPTPLSPLVHHSQKRNRLRCFSTADAKINFKFVACF